jgi:hypothetical protein
MASPARLQVLNTVELLELILGNLTMRDILPSERVSYLWRSVIASSRAIQKRKYLLPDTSESRSVEVNPTFLQRFIQQAAFYTLRQINPSVSFYGMSPFVFDRIDSFADDETSWRRMLLFQPPLRRAYLRPLSARFEDHLQSYMISNKEGLGMEDVVRFFEDRVKEADQVSLRLLSYTVIKKVTWVLTPDLSED